MRETTSTASWQDGAVKAILDRIDSTAWRTQMMGGALDVAVGTMNTVVDIDNDIEGIEINVEEHNDTNIDQLDSSNRVELDIDSNTMTDSCLDFDKAIDDR